jgi:flagellar secretion chaperone FliS
MSTTHARAHTAYGNAAETTPPATRIVLLYDGAIRRLKEAASAIAERRIEDRWTAVAKASAILEALHGCLDLKRGGDLASRLDRLYAYLLMRTQQINVRNDAGVCAEVCERLMELRNAWAAIADDHALLQKPRPAEMMT